MTISELDLSDTWEKLEIAPNTTRVHPRRRNWLTRPTGCSSESAGPVFYPSLHESDERSGVIGTMAVVITRDGERRLLFLDLRYAIGPTSGRSSRVAP